MIFRKLSNNVSFWHAQKSTKQVPEFIAPISFYDSCKYASVTNVAELGAVSLYTSNSIEVQYTRIATLSEETVQSNVRKVLSTGESL